MRFLPAAAIDLKKGQTKYRLHCVPNFVGSDDAPRTLHCSLEGFSDETRHPPLKSLIVEDGVAVRTMAAYIDLRRIDGRMRRGSTGG